MGQPKTKPEYLDNDDFDDDEAATVVIDFNKLKAEFSSSNSIDEDVEIEFNATPSTSDNSVDNSVNDDAVNLVENIAENASDEFNATEIPMNDIPMPPLEVGDAPASHEESIGIKIETSSNDIAFNTETTQDIDFDINNQGTQDQDFEAQIPSIDDIPAINEVAIDPPSIDIAPVDMNVDSQVAEFEDKTEVLSSDIGLSLIEDDLQMEEEIIPLSIVSTKTVLFDLAGEDLKSLRQNYEDSSYEFHNMNALADLNQMIKSTSNAQENMVVVFFYNQNPKAVNTLMKQINSKFPHVKTLIIAKNLSDQKAQIHKNTPSGANQYLSAPNSFDEVVNKLQLLCD